MKKLFLVVLSGFVFLSSLTYPQWVEQTSGITSHFYSVFALDESHAWVGGGAYVLRTTNGGATWGPVAAASGTRNIIFFDTLTGFCTGGGSIYKTTNGGNSWTETKTMGGTINDVFYLDKNTAWALPNNTYVYKTTDGGATWVMLTLPNTTAEYSIHMLNKDVGFIVGINGKFLKTTDGGATWVQQANIGANPLKHIWFCDDNNGVVSTAGGMYRTTDGGASWNFIALTSYWNYEYVTCNTPSKIWVVCTGGLMTSIDNGINWVKETTPTFGYASWTWYSLAFTNVNTGWLVGSSGKIVKTTVATGLSNNEVKPARSIQLSQNYPNPFNPTTTITYTLPERTEISILIYNQLGQNVATLFSGTKEAGQHSVVWNAGNMASGIYFYELRTTKFSSTKKLMLMK